MAHRIGRHQPVGAALRDAIVADLDRSARILTDVELPRAERIHKVRRRLKRARSTLAVLKPVLGESYRRHRRSMTLIARNLAARRDADVVAATARDLSRELSGGEHIIADQTLADLGGVTAHDVLAAPIEIASLSERLRRAAAEARALPAPDEGSELLAHAIRRAYRRGRKAMRLAEAEGGEEPLHEWRKETKHLWHLMRLARKRLPKRASRLAARLDELAETLGAERDCTLVHERTGELVARKEAEAPFRQAIHQRRSTLQSRAFKLGKHAYRRSPRDFAEAFRLR